MKPISKIAACIAILYSSDVGATDSHTEAAASQPSFIGLKQISEINGTYIEVVNTPKGYQKTTRCGPEDHLIIAAKDTTLSLRWSGSSAAKEYPKVQLADGRVTLKERRKTIHLEAVSPDILRITFERTQGRARSYLYGRLAFAKDLPLSTEKDEGCQF